MALTASLARSVSRLTMPNATTAAGIFRPKRQRGLSLASITSVGSSATSDVDGLTAEIGVGIPTRWIAADVDISGPAGLA